ncbi:Hypothetical protein R9X50_00775400 [Acrodontium crateriforme]|uniref:Uncharacterized protein n=1 Tax=Acrodontium crateriforme TaxID=150365 RepID=A0AAQ3MA66_9PEZI|nr:Hypothetical protein R9X50_00775400 [Acrodontium crateriforme]
MMRPRDYISRSWLLSFVKTKTGRASITASIVFILLILISAVWPSGSRGEYISGLGAPKGRLHLLVPATSSNADLCKLMLSAQILGYPAPVLINYGAEENPDPYVQHLAKVETLLTYMHSIKSNSSYSEDLVLILDGYDIWLQLPADVLVRRYFEANRRADDRVIAAYGQAKALEYDMRQTILFGPDKLCWPTDYSRPACWAVPEVQLDDYAFGPGTSGGDELFDQPRWLNSGTVIGPAQDLIDLFQATLDEIHSNYVTNSDQYYFAEIFGRQEYARLSRDADLMAHYKGLRYKEEIGNPDAVLERTNADIARIRTEYYVGIDYNSTMFQTMAFYKQSLTWMRPVDSWAKPGELHSASRYSNQLPLDLSLSLPPYHALGDNKTSWAEQELHYNAITGHMPVAVHYTPPEKDYRTIWWDRIWLYRRAEELRNATIRHRKNQNEVVIHHQPINGILWVNSETEELKRHRKAGDSGADSDTEGWVDWDTLCKNSEEHLYGVPEKDYRHPWNTTDTENSSSEGLTNADVFVDLLTSPHANDTHS